MTLKSIDASSLLCLLASILLNFVDEPECIYLSSSFTEIKQNIDQCHFQIRYHKVLIILGVSCIIHYVSRHCDSRYTCVIRRLYVWLQYISIYIYPIRYQLFDLSFLSCFRDQEESKYLLTTIYPFMFVRLKYQ